MRFAVRFYIPLLIFLALSSSASAQLIVNVRPSRPANITRTSPPGPAYTWIQEDWQVVHDSYEWTGGRWEPIPNRWSIWVPGHWEQRSNGHVWTPGYWKNRMYSGSMPERHQRSNERKEQTVVEGRKANAIK